jgi:hypothetical protein
MGFILDAAKAALVGPSGECICKSIGAIARPNNASGWNAELVGRSDCGDVVDLNLRAWIYIDDLTLAGIAGYAILAVILCATSTVRERSQDSIY